MHNHSWETLCMLPHSIPGSHRRDADKLTSEKPSNNRMFPANSCMLEGWQARSAPA